MDIHPKVRLLQETSVKLDDARAVELVHHINLLDGGLQIIFNRHNFHCHNMSCLLVNRLVHSPIRTIEQKRKILQKMKINQSKKKKMSKENTLLQASR